MLNIIFEETENRVLIIGNSGSGKSWLAEKLAAHYALPPVHLDEIRWQPGQFGVRRDNQLVLDDVAQAILRPGWVMEGVYGWLAEVALPRATELVWLKVPVDECIANISQRGNQGGATEESYRELLAWAGEYHTRGGSTSFEAHSALFEAFTGPKTALTSRADMTTYLSALPSRDPAQNR